MKIGTLPIATKKSIDSIKNSLKKAIFLPRLWRRLKKFIV